MRWYHTSLVTLQDRRRPMPFRRSRFLPTPPLVIIVSGRLTRRVWQQARRSWQWLAFWRF
jgi:hypothetical protein